jgi:hypothetical protein
MMRSFVRPNSGHHIENTADTGLVFLETFASDEFQDVSLNADLLEKPLQQPEFKTPRHIVLLGSDPPRRQDRAIALCRA